MSGFSTSFKEGVGENKLAPLILIDLTTFRLTPSFKYLIITSKLYFEQAKNFNYAQTRSESLFLKSALTKLNLNFLPLNNIYKLALVFWRQIWTLTEGPMFPILERPSVTLWRSTERRLLISLSAEAHFSRRLLFQRRPLHFISLRFVSNQTNFKNSASVKLGRFGFEWNVVDQYLRLWRPYRGESRRSWS